MTKAARTSNRSSLGRNELLFELSSGGMGTVYLARKHGAGGFEKLVVVKRTHPHLAKHPEFRTMLLQEARLSSHVRHRNAVGALSVDEEGDELYLVFEYVESTSLASLLRAARERGERLDPGVVSRILADVLAGLDAAHVARDVRGEPLGIIHRDVSPDNIIVGSDGVSRLIDFGIAKAKAQGATTAQGVLKGKLSYMSPEQIRKKGIDHRSDLFASGSVLFEALTNRRLFDSDDEGAIAVAIMLGADELLGTDLPKEVLPVLERALATSRDERFQSAGEFEVALENALPPKTTRDVAAVVERYAGPRLVELRERIRKSVEAASPKPMRLHGRVAVAAVGAVGLALLVFAATRSKSASLGAPPASSIASLPNGETPFIEPSNPVFLDALTPDASSESVPDPPGKSKPPLLRPQPKRSRPPEKSQPLHESPYGAPAK